MNRRLGPPAARAGAVLLVLVLLASPSRAARGGSRPGANTSPQFPPRASLRWEAVKGLPWNAFVPGQDAISMWPAAGTGLVTTTSPTPSQYYTSDNGSTWTRVSTYYISSVYMAGSQTAFGVGQLEPQSDWRKPFILLKWTPSKGWRVGLQPPVGSGAIAVNPGEIVVTDNGQTVYMLGSLAYKIDDGWSPTGPDGLDTQQIWRYSAATGAWTLIATHTYNYSLIHLMSTYIHSLAAAGSNMALAVWAGPGLSSVRMFNGAAWSVSRQGAPGERVERLLGVQPSRVWAVIFNDNSKTRELWAFDGRRWAKMATIVDTHMFVQLSAPTASFALLGQLPPGDLANKVLVQRWDGGGTGFAPMMTMTVDRSSNANLWDLQAASDKWAVLTSVKRNLSAPGVPRRVDTMVWTGSSRWLRVLPWQLPEAEANADVTALVALPGGALAAMGAVWSGSVPGYGLWRLQQI